MNAKEELLNLWAKLWADGKLGLMEYEGKHFKVAIDFEELAQAVIDAKFVRLADVEIDLDKMLAAFDKHILLSGWEGRVGNYVKFKGKSESDYIPALKEIVKAKPIKIKCDK